MDYVTLLQKYANECLTEMKAVGINVPNKIKFIVNTRAKSRFGQCSYDRIAKAYTIDINVDLLNEKCPLISLKETLFHEIIHTLPNCMNHGSEFKRYASIVNRKYGTNVTRCSTTKEKYGIEYAKEIAERDEKKKKPKVKYELFCENCGKVRASGMYQRMPKWYAHAERYHCSVCGGHLERITGNYTFLTVKGVRN